MQPIEGTRYEDPVMGEFTVVAVGDFHGHQCFVVNVDDELAVFRMEAWPVLFREPEPLGASEDRSVGAYRGRCCHVQTGCSGGIEFKDNRSFH